jgi:outer membrane protein assembly factor BamB
VRPVYAIRPGQRGDISLPEGQRQSAAIAWSHARGGTYIPTPLPYRGLFYTVNNNGILTAYRIDGGEMVYSTRLPMGSFSASPVAADGRLYFASETGEVHVLRAGAEYQLLTTNAMDEVVMATPAMSDGLLLIRTQSQLVGIAEGEKLASN